MRAVVNGINKEQRSDFVRPAGDLLDRIDRADRIGCRSNGDELRPLTPADFARMKRTPQVKIIRRALGLSQDDFAARYHIPIGTLRDWEQGRAVPDQAARAYLTVIARDPEAVRRALDVTKRKVG